MHNKTIERESLDHIMHGGSSIKTKNLIKISIEGVIDLAYLRRKINYLACTNLKERLVTNDTN